MAKIARNQSTGRFTLAADDAGSGMTITDAQTGKRLPLKGYGALKGEFHVREEINLSEPIAAQVMMRKPMA